MTRLNVKRLQNKVALLDTPVFRVQIYPFGMVLGMAQSLQQMCGLKFIATLVGDSPKSSAFVYGFMSFSEKLVNGITIYVLGLVGDSKDCDYDRLVLFGSLSVTSILVISVVTSLWLKKKVVKSKTESGLQKKASADP